MTDTYQTFVSGKLQRTPPTGILGAKVEASYLMPFQRDLTSWALRRGRAAIFADTGLGKTRMEIEWARVVAAHTERPVLILTPLAVAAQTASEGAKIGVEVTICREGADVRPGVNVANYERLHKFDAAAFGGVVLDESSCIKHHDTKTLKVLMDAFRSTAFRLCATATPSPNDYTELGTHAEFLGVCSRTEMLSEYFCHDGGDTSTWRLKGHARALFWRFVATWGAMIRRPSDLGYDDTGYVLPPFTVHHHVIPAAQDEAEKAGLLFVKEASTLSERRAARRASLAGRAGRCATFVRAKWADHLHRTGATTTPLIGKSASQISGPRTSDIGVSVSPAAPHGAPECQNANAKNSAGISGLTTSPTRRDTPIGPRRTSSVVSDSPRAGSSRSSRPKEGSAPFAGSALPGGVDSISTTTTPQGPCAGSSATPAIRSSVGSTMTPIDSPPPDEAAPPSICEVRPLEKWLLWVDLNDEQDALENLFGDLAFSVRGADSIEEKEESIRGWLAGERPVMISKCSIMGWGLNFQHCCRVAFVGVTDSWEAYYQAVRRCYRFGQTKPVEVHIFTSELEGAVAANLKRKEADAMKMAEELSRETRAAVRDEVLGQKRITNDYAPARRMEVPSWLRA